MENDEDMVVINFAVKDAETEKTLKVVAETVKDDNPDVPWIDLVDDAAERVCEEFTKETGKADVYAVEVP